MKWWSIVSMVLAGLVTASADQPLTATAPTLIVDLRGGGFKGVPSQLAWSPDSTTLCVQTLEGDTPPLKTHTYVIGVNEHTFRGVDVAPPWAASYWEWKSARTPPKHPEMVIEVQTQQKTSGIPTQSLQAKAKGGLLENAVDAQNEAGTLVRVLTLKGEVIGQYVNQPLVPGMTFGWSPETLHAVAYAKPDGHLGVLDFNGGKLDVAATKDVLLPAWSPDGTKVVYLQKTGRHEYAVMAVGLNRP